MSFYEGIIDVGLRRSLVPADYRADLFQIVPRESAVLGLPGDVKNQVCLEADDSNMSRFDGVTKDELDNYKLIQANIK